MLKFNLEKLVAKTGKSLYAIAQNTGISYSTIYKIHKNGTTRADLLTIEKLCREFECSIEELIIEDEG